MKRAEEGQMLSENFYEENLASLKIHNYPLYQQLAADNGSEFELAAVNEEGDLGVFVKKGGERRLMHELKKYYREEIFPEANGYLAKMSAHNGAFIFFGLDAGVRLFYACSRSEQSDVFFVIERHTGILKAIMRHFDLRQLFESRKVYIFAGQDAVNSFTDFLRSGYQGQIPFLGAVFCAAEDHAFYQDAQKSIFSLVKGMYEDAQRCLLEVSSHYRQIDRSRLVDVLSEKSGRRLRVLGELNTTTAYMQHSMRTCIKGFNLLGCQTQVLESDTLLISQVYFYKMLREFMPDIYFKINHLAGESYEHPGLITASWIQDYMPFIFNPGIRADKKIGPHDQIFIVAAMFIDDLEKLGFEKDRIHRLYLGADTDVYRSLELCDEDRKKYGSDIAFICHYPDYASANSFIPADVVEYLIEAMREADSYDFAAFREIYQQAKKKFGKIEMNEDACRKCRQIYGDISENVILTTYLWSGLAAASLRLPYLESIRDMNLSLYGKGWSLDPRFKASARGSAAYGDEICKIVNAAKINLNMHAATNNHPRIFDTIAAGGFLLTRLTAEDEEPGGIGELFELGKEIEVFRTKEELREKIEFYLKHDDQRMEIARRGQERLLREHTVKHRMQWVLDIVKEGLLRGGN